jgi:hypothetical protein
LDRKSPAKSRAFSDTENEQNSSELWYIACVLLNTYFQEVLMAKESSKARIRVFFGEIEGDNETVQEGLRSIASAVQKTFQMSTLVKVLPARDSTPND